MAADHHDRDDDLLAAYVDGVTELTPAERRRVEARLAAEPALRQDEAATRRLIGALRELPPEGTAPDWAAMERAIAAQVGTQVPRPWWRSWRWLVPATAVAVATAATFVWLRVRTTDGETTEPTPAVAVVRDAGHEPAPTPAPAPAQDELVALWLDGEAVEIDDVAGAAIEAAPLPEVDEVAEAALAADLLATDDLAWVDDLADEDIEIAEQVLGRKPS